MTDGGAIDEATVKIKSCFLKETVWKILFVVEKR